MGGSPRNAPSDPPKRILRALDINTGKIAWELPQVGSGESRSGTLVTAAGLVFFDEDSGALMAADSATGRPAVELSDQPVAESFAHDLYVR